VKSLNDKIATMKKTAEDKIGLQKWNYERLRSICADTEKTCKKFDEEKMSLESDVEALRRKLESAEKDGGRVLHLRAQFKSLEAK
jgi:predicted  nucleic acid-binding Zn-ribbon protein